MSHRSNVSLLPNTLLAKLSIQYVEMRRKLLGEQLADHRDQPMGDTGQPFGSSR